jgi:hypothetical protein
VLGRSLEVGVAENIVGAETNTFHE